MKSEDKKGLKSVFSKQSKDESMKKEEKININKEKEIIPNHFQRRGNKSISLFEKRKLASQVFKDEL